jgi:hypothetical protein
MPYGYMVSYTASAAVAAYRLLKVVWIINAILVTSDRNFIVFMALAGLRLAISFA